MRCPNCKCDLPENSQLCACGYRFESRTLDAAKDPWQGKNRFPHYGPRGLLIDIGMRLIEWVKNRHPHRNK